MMLNTYPEKHMDYPALWVSDCGKFRIIRCKDDIQWIIQRYSKPDWRGFSYHVNWSSILQRYGNTHTFSTLPSQPPVLQHNPHC